jgi:N-acetylmuramoyl-L-alanine amidase
MKTFDRPNRLIHGSASRLALAAALSVCLAVPAAAQRAPRERRESAQAQFARAEEQRAALDAKATVDRNLSDYKQVVVAYRRVYLITPHAPEVPQALFTVAQLYEEMGGKFGGKYFQSAVDAYQFLIHEYPQNHNCPEAILRVAKIQKDELGQPDLAAKTYEEYLRLYPRSPRRREILETLAGLALVKSAASAPATAPPPEPRHTSDPRKKPEEPPGPRTVPAVRRITTASAAGTSRVVIELDDKVTYQSARIVNPDRIYFDLYRARISSELPSRNIPLDGGLVKSIRVAQNQSGVVRVVFDIAGVKDYTASLLNDPPRLVVDMHASEHTLARRAKGPEADSTPLATSGSARDPEEPSDRSGRAEKANAAKTTVSRTEVRSLETSPDAPREAARATEAAPGPSPTRSRRGKVSPKEPLGPAAVAQPTRNGERSLTRALGLKIGRIVIDPGHGGHDTGTIGPTGFTEKDLCLDVALRLGKIIEQRLPGAEVVYTREDDTFVPLEERTAMANEAKADLFLSIHANSSSDRKTRGIETYYLNLKGTPEAMEVAARENAAAQGGVHDLQNLVERIARNEKLEESREFASEIQDSLAKRVLRATSSAKNRGVRKAPFVVLIGANMPSVLTEISFLSNPADEQLLKKPEARQRIAEGLYQGVVKYLGNLNSLTFNLSHGTPSGRAAGVERSGNQR